MLYCLRKSLVLNSKGKSILVNVINGLSPDINLMSANEEMAVKCILFYFLRLLTKLFSVAALSERSLLIAHRNEVYSGGLEGQEIATLIFVSKKEIRILLYGWLWKSFTYLYCLFLFTKIWNFGHMAMGTTSLTITTTCQHVVSSRNT